MGEGGGGVPEVPDSPASRACSSISTESYLPIFMGGVFFHNLFDFANWKKYREECVLYFSKLKEYPN